MSSRTFKMWSPKKNKDYYFFDRVIKEQFKVGGTGIYVHKYLGPSVIGEDNSTTDDNGNPLDESDIQDILFLENRDRKYDEHIYELMGSYNLQDYELSVEQFGLFVESDIYYLEFHLNDTIEKLGRKMMPGDVLELPHQRDDALLDPDSPAINKFYVVEEVTRAAGGYSPTWYPHIIRVKIKPMTHSQEFEDILNGEDDDGNSLSDILSDYNDKITISDKIIAEADKQVPFRNFETMQFYVVPGDESGSQYPWIFAGDGNPPNGAQLAGSGVNFPENPTEGDWFLRTDFEPNVLFRREDYMWKRKEVDYRRKWSAAHRIIQSFINNKNKTQIQDNNFDEKQPISKAIKPRADF